MTALTHEQVKKILRAGTQPEGTEKAGFEEHLAHCRTCQSYQSLIAELSTDLQALYPAASFSERQIRQKASAGKSALAPRFLATRTWHSLRSAALIAVPLLMMIALGVLAWKLIPVRPAAPILATQTPTANGSLVPTQTPEPPVSLMGTEFPAPEPRPASSFQSPVVEEMVVVQPVSGDLTTYIPKEWRASLEQKKETPMISAILAAPDESTWFASIGGVSVMGTGVYRYDGRKWTRYTTQTGLPSDEITAMVAAHDGSIWFSTLCCGVARYDGSSWATYTVENGLASNDVRSMAVAADGAIWFGTGNQGVTRFDGTRLKTFTTADGLHGNYVGNIYALPDGSILLSTSNGNTAALDRFDGQTWWAYPTDWTDQGKYTRKIAQTPNGDLWYAIENDGVYTRPGGAAWSHVTVETGLLSNTITGLAVDPRGNIWVGTDRGLSVRKGSTWQSYTVADGLAANWVSDIAAASDGSVWVGTAGGVSRFPPPTMEEILSSYVTSNSFGVAFGFDKTSNSPLLVLNSSVKGLVPYDQTGNEYPYIYNLDTGIVFPIYPKIGGNNTVAPPMRARSLSADGRFLLYGLSSNSTEPAAEHYNFIYLRDLTTGKDSKIDFLPLEKDLGTGIYPSLSPDGRYLALNAGENGWQLYLYERSTGKVVPVAVDLGTRFISGANSTEPVFSADGRYLAFVSDSAKLVEGDTACSDANPACGDVFLYEIAAGKIERIPANIQFTMGNPYPYLTVSADARYLAWTEILTSPSADKEPGILLYDRVTGKTRKVWWFSVWGFGPPYNISHSPSISADGRWMAFGVLPENNESGLAGRQAYAQVYLMDLEAANPDGAAILVSADPNGNPGSGPSGIVALQQEGWSSDIHISADGRYVAFSSRAASLLPAGVQQRQCNDPIVVGAYACYDLYVYDRQTGKLTWLGPHGELKKPVP